MGFNEREKNRATGRGVAAILGAGDVKEPETAGKGRPKADRETKKRVTFAILPSLYDEIQKIAFVERKSASEIVSQCLEHYVKKNADKLTEYEQIKGE